MKTLAFDFDGVIHHYSKGFSDGTIYDPPEPGAFAAIEKLLKEYYIYVHSTRDPRQVYNWFHKEHAPFETQIADSGLTYWNVKGTVGISQKKFPALAYIDDRGIRFISWKDILGYFG